jgi:magnesium transporter
MDLESDLANRLLEAHPVEAGQALESLPVQEIASLLAKVEPARAAGVLQWMDRRAVAGILAKIGPARSAEIGSELPIDVVAQSLRHIEPGERDALIDMLPGRRARALRSLLRFPENSAGSLVDPEVLALPQDLTVKEAQARVREAAQHARYNLYVVDRNHVLVGVLNLRELLLARPNQALSELMKTQVRRLSAGADRHTIVAHPGWREVHSLPVVDEAGVYLGALRYKTLMRLEEALQGAKAEGAMTARALGDLFRTGATGMLEAMTATLAPGEVSPEKRSRDGS